MKKAILTILYICMAVAVYGQRHEIYSDRIASLTVTAGTDWLNPPVISLDASTPIVIAFDDLTHDYHRYSYRLDHCEADWTVSEGLFQSDYCEGFTQGNTIDDYEQSEGTYQLYTHYTLELPNDECRMKMSGNYKLTVLDEYDDNRPVLTACFMVVESLMTVGMEVLTNTDIDFNRAHQQIAMTLNYGSLRVTDPQQQVKVQVMQNGRWSNSVISPKAQYVMANGLKWDHCRDLIFPAGNVYRKFEMLDPSHTTMGMERIGWDGEKYLAWTWIDEPRPSYVHDESAQGAFYLRNSDNENNDTESEYILMHFRLRSPKLPGEVYINGAWTRDQFSDEYKMEWNEQEQLYELSAWLKQGYYSYQYLWRGSDGSFRPVPSEGSFYQTKNAYQALVYYRGNGERADRLVGYGKSE